MGMNKQDKGNGSRGIQWTDYTWNPISGCFHACQWAMPDGSIANCYAEDVATRVAGSAYPQGFEHHYWKPQILAEPVRRHQPCKIFVGSMADVFGHWVEDDQIKAVLQVAHDCPQHIFQFLTKNPKRLQQFTFPPNCWIGISSPPSFMWNKPLTGEQQDKWLKASLRSLYECGAHVKWMSIEPLSYDIAADLWEWGSFLDWIVIGAASNGKTIYQPEPAWVEDVLLFADAEPQRKPVFFKGNLAGNPAAVPWREEFPCAQVV